MKTKVISAPILTFALILAMPLVADHHEAEPGAYARNLAFVGGRAVQLANAIPEDDYMWRPMEGVRTVSEAIMHTASTNYYLANSLGLPAPEGVDIGGMEKVTAKSDCVAALEASIAHISKAIDAVKDPEAAMDIFGRPGTKEDMMLIAIGHVHEHFGQLIAYARSNEVVPPWSK